MELVIENGFQEIDLNELLLIDGEGYWTGLGAAVIGGLGTGVGIGGALGGPVGAGGGALVGGIVGGILYVV